MSEERDLKRLLQKLAAEAPSGASPSAEAQLLAAFRKQRVRRRQHRLLYWTAAACLAMALGFASWRLHRAGSYVQPLNQNASTTSGFIPLPYSQSDVPIEQAVIVRVDLPASAWGTLNVPTAAPAAARTVRADLLIGQDGMARAVRVISVQ